MVELSPKCILNTLSVLGEAKDIIKIIVINMNRG